MEEIHVMTFVFVMVPVFYNNDVIKWKHFPCYLPFERGIHRLPVNSPHKGQRLGALVFPLICAWINGWVNNREAGDLRRHRTHYDVTEIILMIIICTNMHIFYINAHLQFIFTSQIVYELRCIAVFHRRSLDFFLNKISSWTGHMYGLTPNLRKSTKYLTLSSCLFFSLKWKLVNSLWPSDAIWRQRSGFTLAPSCNKPLHEAMFIYVIFSLKWRQRGFVTRKTCSCRKWPMSLTSSKYVYVVALFTVGYSSHVAILTCSHNTSQIYFIFTDRINQLQKMCRMLIFATNFEILIFDNFCLSLCLVSM